MSKQIMPGIRRTRGDVVFDTVNTVIMVIMLILFMYPLYYCIIASISDPQAVAGGQIFFWPKGATLESYGYILSYDRVWLGYRNTIFYTVFGTMWNLFLTIPSGYVLSKRNLYGRSVLAVYFLIPMYFGGGLIPFYLLMKDIGLINKWYTLIVMGGLSIFNMIIVRVYYDTSIPGELYDAAKIDGCGDFHTFIRIALPLSKPVIAVMTLYYAVGHWNDYYTAMIYTPSAKLHPLPLVIRSVLILNVSLADAIKNAQSMDEAEALIRQAYIAQTMKFSLIMVSSLPMLAAYPFVQKYFVKGVMIGSLKG